MKNIKVYVFALIMCAELVIMGTISMLTIFWMDMMDSIAFTLSIPIIGFLLVMMVTELLFRIYMNSQILSIKNQKDKNSKTSLEELISLEMALNRNEVFWIAISQYFWVTCLNLYIVYTMNRYDFFIGGVLIQIIMTVFIGIYGSSHNKKCYRDGMLMQAIYYAGAYQELCKELIDYTNNMDKHTKEEVIRILKRRKENNQENVKEVIK